MPILGKQRNAPNFTKHSHRRSHKKQRNVGSKKRWEHYEGSSFGGRSLNERGSDSQNEGTLQESFQVSQSPKQTNLLYNSFKEKTGVSSPFLAYSPRKIDEAAASDSQWLESLEPEDSISKYPDEGNVSRLSWDSLSLLSREDASMIQPQSKYKPKGQIIRGSDIPEIRARITSETRSYTRKQKHEFIPGNSSRSFGGDVEEVIHRRSSSKRSGEASSSLHLSELYSYFPLKSKRSSIASPSWYSQGEIPKISDQSHHLEKKSSKTAARSTKHHQKMTKASSQILGRANHSNRVVPDICSDTLGPLNRSDVYQHSTRDNLCEVKSKYEVNSRGGTLLPSSCHIPDSIDGLSPCMSPDARDVDLENEAGGDGDGDSLDHLDPESFLRSYDSLPLESKITPDQSSVTDFLPPISDDVRDLLSQFEVFTPGGKTPPSNSSQLPPPGKFSRNSFADVSYSRDVFTNTLDADVLSSIPEEIEIYHDLSDTSCSTQKLINSDHYSVNVVQQSLKAARVNNGKAPHEMDYSDTKADQFVEDSVTEMLSIDMMSTFDHLLKNGGSSSERLDGWPYYHHSPDDVEHDGPLGILKKEPLDGISFTLGKDIPESLERSDFVPASYTSELCDYLDIASLSPRLNLQVKESEMISDCSSVEGHRQRTVKDKGILEETTVKGENVQHQGLLAKRPSVMDPPGVIDISNYQVSDIDHTSDLCDVTDVQTQGKQALHADLPVWLRLQLPSNDLSNDVTEKQLMQSTNLVFHEEQMSSSQGFQFSSSEGALCTDSRGQAPSSINGFRKIEQCDKLDTLYMLEDPQWMLAKERTNDAWRSDQTETVLQSSKLPNVNLYSEFEQHSLPHNVQEQLKQFRKLDHSAISESDNRVDKSDSFSKTSGENLMEENFEPKTLERKKLNDTERDASTASLTNTDDVLTEQGWQTLGERSKQDVSWDEVKRPLWYQSADANEVEQLTDHSLGSACSLHLSELEGEDIWKRVAFERDAGMLSSLDGSQSGKSEKAVTQVESSGHSEMVKEESEAVVNDTTMIISDLDGHVACTHKYAYSLPSDMQAERKEISHKRKRNEGRIPLKSKSVSLRRDDSEFKKEMEKEKMSYSLTLQRVHSSPKKSILQNVSLLSGVGWTVRVRNVLCQNPRKNWSDLVAKAYWMKRWRTGTRVQKMIKLEEKTQMQSAVLFHEVSLLHKYLTKWRQIPKDKLHQACDLHRRHLLSQGLYAMKRAVEERKTKTKWLQERLQQHQLRSSFYKWLRCSRLHQHQEQVALKYLEEKRLVPSFQRWKAVYDCHKKDRVAILHYKLCLLATFFLKWKVFVSDQRVKYEQAELARVYHQEMLLKASWDAFRDTYRKKLAAKRQDRLFTLMKVIRAWRHGAQLCRLETIQLHQMAQEFRRVHTLRAHLLSWQEEVTVCRARQRIDTVKLSFTFHLWKLKLERKRLVRRIIESKMKRATKMRIMTAWREQTIRDRERRQRGLDAFQNYQKRRAFEAWRELLSQKNERRTRLKNHITEASKVLMKSFFRLWKVSFIRKRNLKLEEEARKRQLVEKFTRRWREAVKRRQNEMKIILFQERRTMWCMKAAFSAWTDAFSEAMDDKHLLMEARAAIDQNRLHRLFWSWRLTAREGAVIRPLLEKRRKKRLQRIFSSWHLLIQRKRIVELMKEERNKRRVTLSFFGWRQKYLSVLQLKLAKETLEQNHLSRLFKAWYLVRRNRRQAENLAQQRELKIIRQSFDVWKSKLEEAELTRERSRGLQMRAVLLRRSYLRRWIQRHRTNRHAEDEICILLEEQRRKTTLHLALHKWRQSYQNEVIARDHHEAASSRILRVILIRWHQYAKHSFQFSLEMFSRSVGLSSSAIKLLTPSNSSRIAQASDGSHSSATLHQSVVDSGYHGNNACHGSLSTIKLHLTSPSDGVTVFSDQSDLDVASFQKFPLFSDKAYHSLKEENETVQSCDLSVAYSSVDSSPDFKISQDRLDSLTHPSMEMDDSSCQTSVRCRSALFSEREGDVTSEASDMDETYLYAGETGISIPVWTRHTSYGESITSQEKPSLAASCDDNSSVSSCQVITVEMTSTRMNVLREVWMGEVAGLTQGGDDDSLGVMSLQELADEDIGDLDRYNDGEMRPSLLQDGGDVENCETRKHHSRVVLLTYMINFWRLWPASAAFLQWLNLTKRKNHLRRQQDNFKVHLMNDRLRYYTNEWRKQLMMVQKADQCRQRSALIEKCFEAFKRYQRMKKASRLNQELAENWRRNKSLFGSFQKWKYELVKAHTIQVDPPSWKSFAIKKQTLEIHSNSLRSKIKRDNIKECFMFWKIRAWQKDQVERQYEKTVIHRCFKSWLQWIRIKRERKHQMELFLHKRQKQEAYCLWREAFSHQSKVQQMRSKVNSNHLREVLHLWHKHSQKSREKREHFEIAQNVVARTTLHHFWNVWNCEFKKYEAAGNHSEHFLKRKCFHLWVMFRHQQIQLDSSALHIKRVADERQLRETFHIWRKRLKVKKRLTALIKVKEQRMLKVFFENWRKCVSLEREELQKQHDLMGKVITHWLMVYHQQRCQRSIAKTAVAQWTQFVLKMRKLTKLQEDYTSLKDQSRVERCWKMWKETALKNVAAERFYANNLCKRFLHEWFHCTREKKKRLSDEKSLCYQRQQRLVLHCFYRWKDAASEVRLKHQMAADFDQQRSLRLVAVCFQSWLRRTMVKRAETYHRRRVEKQVLNTWKAAFMNIQIGKQSQETSERNSLQVSFTAFRMWCVGKKSRRHSLQSFKEKQERNKVSNAFRRWKGQTKDLTNADKFHQNSLLRRHFIAWLSEARRKKHLRLVSAKAHDLFTSRRIRLSFVDSSGEYLEVSPPTDSNHSSSNELTRVCFNRWKERTSQRENHRLEVVALAQRAAAHWRWFVEQRKYERQLVLLKEETADQFHRQYLCLSAFRCWKKQTQRQKEQQMKRDWLLLKYGRKWMNITVQRIVAEQMDHYWRMRRTWNYLRSSMVRSLVVKKFIKAEERRLCAKVFDAWKLSVKYKDGPRRSSLNAFYSTWKD